MKKLLFSVVLVLGIYATSRAQQERGGGMRMGTPEEMAKRNLEQIDEKVKLDDVQKDSVYSYLEAQAKVQQQLFEKAREGGDRQKLMGQMQVLQEDIDKKIKGVLSEDQVKKYDAYAKERNERMQRGPGGRRQ